MPTPTEELVVTRFGERGAIDLRTPPAPDEFEISLFGPGVGECVVIHLGEGQWMIVDSCVDTITQRPVAVDYLAGLGVDVAAAVKILVVTHWHDDHMRGAAATLKEAESALCVCSAALREAEFKELVAANELARTTDFGTSELSAIYRILLERRPRGARPASVGPELAVQNKRLFAGNHIEVYALSPSSASMTLAMQEIAHVLPSKMEGVVKRRLVAQTANQVAVTLWIDFHGIRALLGADLERSTNPLTGWQAIVSSAARPAGQAQIYKVAHHGSVTADDPSLWGTLLARSPYALMTPFSRAGLPTETDLRRISTRTDRAFCTAPAGGWAPPRRSNVVERMAKAFARDRRAATGPMGHVRLRLSPNSVPQVANVQLSQGAFRVGEQEC